jgi:hypothetical protein
MGSLGLLEMMVAVRELRVGEAVDIARTMPPAERINPLLMGDIAAVRAWAESLDRLTRRLPSRPWLMLPWLIVIGRLSRSEREQVDDARRRVVLACEAQEDRVLSGGAPVLLVPGDVRSAIDLDGIEARINRLVSASEASNIVDAKDSLS